MAEDTPTKPSGDQFKDHLVITHPDGQTEKFPSPADEGEILKIGRELDNNIVLTDPRASRYHAEVRLVGETLEIKDLGSANGTFIDGNRLEADIWEKLAPRKTLLLAETKLVWEKSFSSQSTMVMARQKRVEPQETEVPPRTHKQPAVPPAPAPVVPAPAEKSATPVLTWVLAAGAAIALLVFVVVVMMFIFRDTGSQTAQQPGQTTEASGTPARSAADSDLSQQSTEKQPTPTPTPSGPQLAIPVVEETDLVVSPIIFGASPTTKNAYLFIDVRVRNTGNIPFIFSIKNFSLKDRRSGQTFTEAGANTSEGYLKQLGAIDRFEGLGLTPGGSVPGSLVFEVEIGTYDLELAFNAPDVAPVLLGLGSVNMRRELDLAAGTPMAAIDGVSGEPTAALTPTTEPTPTATRPAAIPAPQVVSRSALAGTIAYPVFNGDSFDLYLGDVASTETRFFRADASQPAFNADGSRIAYHSWDRSAQGLMTMDVSGANGKRVASFVEDQLPTWTADSQNIIFLSRRTGDRKSQVMTVDANTENSDGTVVGEGEYPAIGANGSLVFKGWGNTAFGLRMASAAMQDIKTVTNVEGDTAPVLSPDGSKVAFMSQRDEGNWNVYVVNVDGSNLQRLTDDPAEDGLPVWSPDGNAIAFASNRGGIWAVWVMTPDGKGVSQLFTMPGTPDGFVGNDTYASRGWAEERLSWTSAKLVK